VPVRGVTGTIPWTIGTTVPKFVPTTKPYEV